MDDSDNTAALDLRALTPWLLSTLPGARPPFTATQIGGGQSNLTYRLADAQGHIWVLRRPPLGALLASAHDVIREAKFLVALQGSPVAVPRVYAAHECPPGADTPVVLMEYIDGHSVDSEAAALELPAPARERAGMALSEMLADLHRVRHDTVGLADLARPRPYAERQLTRWARQWNSSSRQQLTLFEEVTSELRRVADPSMAQSVLHGDLHLRNVLLNRHTGDVRTVLDWELAAIGEPLADLGTLLAYWQDGNDSALPPFPETRVPDFVGHQQLVNAYEARVGIPVPLGRLRFWHALALWKIAIILQGVIDRAAGAVTDALSEASSSTDDVIRLLEAALTVVRDPTL